MEHTVGTFQDLQYRNVISKYYRVSVTDLADAIEQFLKGVQEAGYTGTDLFFYSINSPINDGSDILVEFFVPVKEDYQEGALTEGYLYHSWFQVLDMVATRVEGDSLEAFEEGTQRLEAFINPPQPKGLLKRFFNQRPQLVERTPPFFLTLRTEDKVYTDIMIGVIND